MSDFVEDVGWWPSDEIDAMAVDQVSRCLLNDRGDNLDDGTANRTFPRPSADEQITRHRLVVRAALLDLQPRILKRRSMSSAISMPCTTPSSPTRSNSSCNPTPPPKPMSPLSVDFLVALGVVAVAAQVHPWRQPDHISPASSIARA
jgi:hypothetical protein